MQSGSIIPRGLKYEFKWLANGQKIPLLQIDARKVLGSMVVTNVIYVDSNRTSVPQVGIVENKANDLHFSIYPNPCFNEATISYRLPVATSVKISITDLVGKKIAEIVNETQTSGVYQKSINTADLHLNSGIYFLHLQTNNFKETHKIVVAN